MKQLHPATNSMKTALVVGVGVVASNLCAAPAAAQPAAPQAVTGAPSYATTEESIRGRIASFDGKYRLQLRDDRGFVDNVTLHDGTIINPTGLRLAPGQSVTIMGHNTGKTFEANQIDTPYATYGASNRPAYAYGYVPYGYAPYGYRYYGSPYRAYPAYGLGFRTGGFGFRGWF